MHMKVRVSPCGQEETSGGLVRGSHGSHGEVQLCFLETCVLLCGHGMRGECALQTVHAVHGGAGGSSEGQRWLWGVQRAAGQLRLLMQW